MDLRTRITLCAPILFFVTVGVLASCMPGEAPPESPPETFAGSSGELQLRRIQFPALTNWDDNDVNTGFVAFSRSCVAILAMAEDAPLGGAGYGGTASDWRPICIATANISEGDTGAARNFFEAEFVPYIVMEGANDEGLFTGYFEPELIGSTIRAGQYQTPLYGLPDDLVSVDLGLFRDSFMGQRIAGRLLDRRLVPYDTRAEITSNGLDQAEELLYVDDPVDAFFLAIQGSGRVRLEDGSVVRAAYAGQNGHPYTAIGAVLIREGELALEEVSMQSIRAWLEANPNSAQALLDQNASYIFFSVEPLDDPALGARGTEGVPLTAEASLAVDANMHPLGVPIWLETTAPMGGEIDTAFHRLLIAQDTGGAINGALRGDIYWGVGVAAGEIAGRMRSQGKMMVLLPRIIADRIGENFPTIEVAP